MKQHWWMARVYTGGHYQTTDAHQTGSTAPTYRLCRSVSSPASSKTWFLLLHLSCSSSEVSEKKIKVCSSFCYTAYLTLIHVTVTFLTHCLLLFTAKQDSAGSPHKRAVDHAYLLRGTLSSTYAKCLHYRHFLRSWQRWQRLVASLPLH